MARGEGAGGECSSSGGGSTAILTRWPAGDASLIDSRLVELSSLALPPSPLVNLSSLGAREDELSEATLRA